ncbi:hypothetical protein CP49_23375 [Bradyrhizobium valentinum]|uniref:Uncharacterized protein n=1 Tax=Bradyrhizobium valentinum TaxID=1518501 RepID=A0A0R3M3X5_9BRAD|nr:hypothetical protein CP49_23375 [Bradyrhizobium valentinum]
MQVGPAAAGAEAPESSGGDGIANLAERGGGELPPRIEPAPDHVDEECLQGEFGRRRRRNSPLPARLE